MYIFNGNIIRWNEEIKVTLQAKSDERRLQTGPNERRTERANLIWGGWFSERNIGDWGRSRRNSGGGGTVHHGNFYSGESDERQRTRVWTGKGGDGVGEGGQEWYGYHGKMCRVTGHGTSPVISPEWNIQTHAKTKEIKKITYFH